MKNTKRFLATALLTTTAVAQLATVALAKETSNSATDTRSDQYSNTAHTTFGVIETDKDVSGQVSYEVPLFVTMAATPERSNMLLPTEDQYYIENTSGDIKDADTVIETNPIGVTSVKVKGLATNTWKIQKEKVDSTNNKDVHLMSFKIADMDLALKDNPLEGQFERTLYDDSYIKNAGGTLEPATSSWKKVTEKNQFVKVDAVKGNSLVKIGRKGDRLNVKLESTIAKLPKADRTNGGNENTTGLFKVQYTLAALDANGQPKLAAVYAGDDWVDAGYKTNPTK